MIGKRKIIHLILCLATAISLVACGNRPTRDSSDTSEPKRSQRTIEKTDSTTTHSPAISSSPSSQNFDTETVWGLQINTVTLDLVPVTEEVFKDNVLTVLNVWGTWCPPCVEELPELQIVSERFKDKNVQIVGVMQDGIIDIGIPDHEMIEAGKILAADAKAEYMMILPDETLMTRFIYEMQYFPTTFFLDAKGEVVHTEVGSMNADRWEMIINDVLKEISN